MTLFACILMISCGGGLTQPADSAEEPPRFSLVPQARLTPGEVVLDRAETKEISLEVRSSNGSILNRSGSWRVGDPSIAKLSGTGSTRTVEGLSSGTTVVVASADGAADTAAVMVAADPVIVFDPDRFSSTQELMDDPYGVFGGSELGGNIHLDSEVARPGGSKSMRYDYVDQGIGNSLHYGRRIPFPDDAKEVWIEAQLRWSTNFFDIQDFPQDGSTFAHKLMFVEAVAPGGENNWTTSDGFSVYRWALLWPAGGSASPPCGKIGVGSPVTEDGNTEVEPYASAESCTYFDAQWHTVRWHIRHDPGVHELWIDGVKVLEHTGFTIHPEVVSRALLLGRNKDDGIEEGTESLWWGKVTIWDANPWW